MAREIFTESVLAIQKEWRLFVLLMFGVAAAFAAERALRRPFARRRRQSLHFAALAGVLALGLGLGWQQRFLCDDAFISFRYAENLARGRGLVWNAGERVEGYTNFLWTALLGGLGRLGADIPLSALVGCLAAFVLALLASAAAVRRLAPRPPLVPFATLALAGALPFHMFATSGLETMPAAALVVTALHASTLPRGELLAGLSLTAATLMRPDHGLFFGCFGAALVLEDLLCGEGPLAHRLDVRRYASFAAPFFLIYVPYYLLRWRYYGDFYPNTYYVKSAGLPYFRQGLVYATHFAATSGAWAWLPAAFLAMLGRPRARPETRARLFALLALPIFATYVAKVGGDFMEYRFFVSLLPVVAVAAEVGLRWRLVTRPRPSFSNGLVGAATIVGVAAALLPVRLIPARQIRWGISWEPSFYRVKAVRPLLLDCSWQDIGRRLHAALTSRGVAPPLAAGAIGMIGYYSRLPVIDALGLTNRAIAHKPLGHRGRPGHEKQATVPELLGEGAVIAMIHLGDPYFRDATAAHAGGVRFHFLRLDPFWADAVAALPGALMPRPERDVDAMIAAAPRERVVAAVHFYRTFLKGHPLRAPLLERLAGRLAAVADFEGKLPPNAVRSGTGLRLARGGKPRGASGKGWLSSLPDTRGGRVGRIEIPIEVPIGSKADSELRFVLGGSPSDHLSVRLVVDGRVVREVSPSGCPGLVPVSWFLHDLRGESGLLVIEDADPRPGKGLQVDAIHFAPPLGDVRTRIADLDSALTVHFGELLQEAEALLPPDDPDLVRLSTMIAARFTFDHLPEGTVLSGRAFGPGPVVAAAAHQQPVAGFEGASFLNSFHGGDAATGRVELPEIELPEAPISVRVGGGENCDKAYVGLEVDGQIVRRVCGRGDELLRPEQLRTGLHAGQRGRIVIVDEATGPWGHILADDIVIVRSPAGARLQ